MSRMLSVYLLILVSLVSQVSYSQVNLESSIDIEKVKLYGDDAIVEVGENGVIIISNAGKGPFVSPKWKVEKYNTDLELADMEEIDLRDYVNPSRIVYSDTLVQRLFYDSELGKVQLLSIEVEDFKLEFVKVKIPRRARLSRSYFTRGDYTYLGISHAAKSHILKLNWRTGEETIIPVEIESVNVKRIISIIPALTQKEEDLYFRLLERTELSDIRTTYAELSEDAKALKVVYQFEKDLDFKIVQSSIYSLRDDDIIITGACAMQVGNNPQGVFISKVSDGSLQYVNYYSFKDFKNFTRYADRARLNLSPKYITYSMVRHPIIPLDDGFLFIAEAFLPVTANEGSGYDGVRYTHAIIVKFDNEGNLMWDKSFKQDLGYNPDKVGWYLAINKLGNESIELSYIARESIKKHTLNIETDEISKASSISLKKLNEKLVHYQTNSIIRTWYDKNYLAYGTQKLKGEKQGVYLKKFYFE